MNSALIASSWGRALGKKLMKGTTKLKPANDTARWNIVTGDIVRVIQGPQQGQQGKVTDVLRKSNRIIVEGVNMRKRAVKPKMDGTPGKMVIKPCSLPYSNVMLIDPTTGEPTRVSRRFLEDGTKVRVSKRSGHVIPKPDPLANRLPRDTIVGPKDTLASDVHEVTFAGYDDYLPYIYESENRKMVKSKK